VILLVSAACAFSALGAGCQGKSSAGSAVPAAAPAIELRDAKGKVTARVTPGHPCRATVDGIELLIGTAPLVAQLGEIRWTGDEAANGTTIKRNDEVIARIFPVDQQNETGLYTPEGVALFRGTLAAGKLDLISGAGALIGSATKLPKGGIAIGDRTITGTDDLLLAALLAAEAPPEVRGLAACHRLFPQAKAL
jgi:hypothetical protein